MADEYYERYRQLSHAELYAKLKAGDPDQVEDVVSSWKTMETTASSLAGSLTADLQELRNGWESAAGREFQRRVRLIADYAQTLADEFGAIHTGLSTMRSALAEALPKAEHPDATDDHDKALSGAARGAAIGSVAGPVGTVVGGVVGGLFGHDPDEEEKKRAHERMVRLVAGLAAQYAVADYSSWPDTVPTGPVDLPAGSSGGSLPTPSGPAAGTVGSGPRTGQISDLPAQRDPDVGAPGGVPIPGGGGHPGAGAGSGTDPRLGSGLAGVSPGAIGAAGAGVAGIGAGAAGLGMAGLRRSSNDSGASGSGLSAVAGGGVGNGAAGAMTGARGLPAIPTAGPNSTRPPMAHGTAGLDEESDEHSTWLTEDDIVWGNDEEAAPAVIGQPDRDAEE